MGHRRTVSSASAGQSPGPGRYNLGLREHRQTAVFGTESRDYESPTLSGRISYLDTYSASADPVRPRTAAYTFNGRGPEHPSSSFCASSCTSPGPGHYSCAYQDKNVSAPSFVTSVSQGVSTNSTLREPMPYFDANQYHKRESAGLQKFSMLDRFLGGSQTNSRFRYTRLLKRPSIHPHDLIDRNVQTAWSRKRAEKLRRLVDEKSRQEFLGRAVVAAKERIVMWHNNPRDGTGRIGAENGPDPGASAASDNPAKATRCRDHRARLVPALNGRTVDAGTGREV